MKRFVLSFLAFLLVASVSFAQQSPADAPASKEDIEKYLAVMHTRDMMKTMMDAMSKQIHQIVNEQLKKQPGITPEDQERAAKLTDDTLKNMPIDDILNAMIPVYQRHFTKANIDDLLAFYSTPTGQKIVRELPAITTEAMQAATPIAQKMMADTAQRVEEQIAQMQKSEGAGSKKQSQQN
jgi:uncharacterized protein